MSRHKNTVKQKAFLDALVRADGNITVACEQVKLPRRTYYDWMSNDPDFAQEYKDILETMNDMVESLVVAKVRSGDTYWITKWLSAKAKDRGWGESTKQEHSGSLDINITKRTVTDGDPN